MYIFYSDISEIGMYINRKIMYNSTFFIFFDIELR